MALSALFKGQAEQIILGVQSTQPANAFLQCAELHALTKYARIGGYEEVRQVSQTAAILGFCAKGFDVATTVCATVVSSRRAMRYGEKSVGQATL